MPAIDPEEPCPCGSGKRYKDCHARLARRTEPLITEHQALTVVREPDPGTRTVFEKAGNDPLFAVGSETGISYDCGSCGVSLLAGIDIQRVVNIVLRCAQCGSFNDTDI